MADVVIVAPVRTAIGKYNGSLAGIPAVELGAAAIRGTMLRSGLDKGEIASVTMGNVVQAGNRMNPARQAAIHGGLPVSVPAVTVNRVCGSGAEAIASAAKDIWLGNSKAAIAGGMENMDRAPYLMNNGRWGYRMGHAEIYDSMLLDGLHDAFSDKHSGWHTEDAISSERISREDQDRWAARSQQRFSAAQAEGRFAGEIVDIDIPVKGGVKSFDMDETPRADTTVEGLGKLKPAFRPDGTITAGNAPGLNSGASAMIVANRDFAEQKGLQPIARLVSYGVAAMEPGMFALAPVPAVQQALERANWTIGDIERIEVNEAYAAVPLAVLRNLGLPEDIVNVEGGAVAHGHPIGATGAILTTRLLYSMQRDGLKRGVVTLCIGGGQGIALALEIV
ncbi:thiolase family protein [Rhizobium sp. XQZ8]|uniref:thiolase family protein n=1 Tax=Rhizobium populisoli TaxID=2859785 RepID=UPI001C67917F|nr:thiolase family protein [Rhizobium populisoli]MBW6422815.1 thiolase family protein [Rhizobium populisoli]